MGRIVERIFEAGETVPKGRLWARYLRPGHPLYEEERAIADKELFLKAVPVRMQLNPNYVLELQESYEVFVAQHRCLVLLWDESEEENEFGIVSP